MYTISGNFFEIIFKTKRTVKMINKKAIKKLIIICEYILYNFLHYFKN